MPSLGGWRPHTRYRPPNIIDWGNVRFLDRHLLPARLPWTARCPSSGLDIAELSGHIDKLAVYRIPHDFPIAVYALDGSFTNIFSRSGRSVIRTQCSGIARQKLRGGIQPVALQDGPAMRKQHMRTPSPDLGRGAVWRMERRWR